MSVAVTLLATKTSLGAFKAAKNAGLIFATPASIEDAASLPHRMLINAIVCSARLNKCEYNYCMDKLKTSNAWFMGPRKKSKLKPLYEVAHEPDMTCKSFDQYLTESKTKLDEQDIEALSAQFPGQMHNKAQLNLLLEQIY